MNSISQPREYLNNAHTLTKKVIRNVVQLQWSDVYHKI